MNNKLIGITFTNGNLVICRESQSFNLDKWKEIIDIAAEQQYKILGIFIDNHIVLGSGAIIPSQFRGAYHYSTEHDLECWVDGPDFIEYKRKTLVFLKWQDIETIIKEHLS